MKSCVFFLTITLLLMACQPSRNAPSVTPTVDVDCETAWEREEANTDKDLDLVLELEELEFSYDKLNNGSQPLHAKFELINIGSTPIWVNNRMKVNDKFPENRGEIYFVLISPWGETAILSAYIDALEPSEEDFVLLGPNETLRTESYGIMYYQFLSLLNQKSSVGFPEGRYCLWAVYHNQSDPGFVEKIWKGEIKSDYVEFEVIK